MLIKIQTYFLNLYTFKDDVSKSSITNISVVSDLHHKASFVLGVRRQCLFFDPVCVQSPAVNPTENSI